MAKTRISAVLWVLLVLSMTVSVHAGPVVSCEVKKVREHDLLMTFVWDVSVVSEKHYDACDLSISFQDGQGREILIVKETIEIKAGSNAFEGHEICDIETWQRIKKYVAKLDCVF
ncbi:MAG: hypothetical protein ACOWYE_08475 [Desulfatiglandales bacterium]